MLKIGTVAIQRRHQLPDDVIFIDATVKSGVKMFAPTWDLVMGSKRFHKGEANGISNEEYLERYRELLRERFKSNSDWFKDFFEEHKDKTIALGCYCPYGDFCHRHYLKGVLGKIAAHWGYSFDLLEEFCKELK